MTDALLLTQALAAFYMTGVIWVIQQVHYPLMSHVSPTHFAQYAKSHVDRMGGIVGPIMILEAVTLVLLATNGPLEGLPPLWLPANLLLLGIVWGVTFGCSVPCHRKLVRQFDPTAHRRLVATNWFRTAAWTLRSGLSAYALWITR